MSNEHHLHSAQNTWGSMKKFNQHLKNRGTSNETILIVAGSPFDAGCELLIRIRIFCVLGQTECVPEWGF